MTCVCSWLSKHCVCFWVMLHLCRTICDAGDFQVVGPDGPLSALAGEDLVLPCSLKPIMNAENMTVEWIRLDDQGQSSLVHLYKDHKDTNTNQVASYRGRTSLSKEDLRKGDASLHLKQLRVADTGRYKCLILSTDYDDILVQLYVVSLQPVISLHKVDGEGLTLVCKFSAWGPRSVVDWLDGERGELPADRQEWNFDKMTVKRRLVVDKGKKNSTYICVVSQDEKMKETIFHINEGWFDLCDPLQKKYHIALGFAVGFPGFLFVSFCWLGCYYAVKEAKEQGDGSENQEQVEDDAADVAGP